MNAIKLYRWGRWCQERRIPLIPQLIHRLIFLFFNSYIPLTAEIGEGTTLAYGGAGVVLHAEARIGRNVVIAHQVTLGGRWPLSGVPVVEDDSYIGPGAKILGPIRIGAGSVVGANAVVIRNVPPGSVVVGVPARVVRSNIRIQDYRAPEFGGSGERPREGASLGADELAPADRSGGPACRPDHPPARAAAAGRSGKQGETVKPWA